MLTRAPVQLAAAQVLLVALAQHREQLTWGCAAEPDALHVQQGQPMLPSVRPSSLVRTLEKRNRQTDRQKQTQ